MNIIQITQPFQNRMSNQTHDINIDLPDLPADIIKGALVHELHAYADVGFGQERSKAGDDVL